METEILPKTTVETIERMNVIILLVDTLWNGGKVVAFIYVWLWIVNGGGGGDGICIKSLHIRSLLKCGLLSTANNFTVRSNVTLYFFFVSAYLFIAPNEYQFTARLFQLRHFRIKL